jgi:hypothetical protein
VITFGDGVAGMIRTDYDSTPLSSVILRGERIENRTGTAKPLWCKNCTGVVLVCLWFPKKRAPITYSAPETMPKKHKKDGWPRLLGSPAFPHRFRTTFFVVTIKQHY